ncbi:cysteine hydrolase family protein [Alicyclobacillus acidocaldarius]|uniref:Isochorismatase hydrolase n=1 Tax=Alicyclobacillus acidocaldarius subsp. acidocaldarius (strain ATCC 27009 / DSM 446 / BCRC 14685 / JCM 5260 / KCTC 1825 / NBRC 15652 / NCIMB 11725 / NRRL B-14509 / 104-IA) TaxID=521098 RepID=C8WUS2_ALIAD|nr:isochorismatase family cysteine hydrolase [Alicyclobacillus acidocaldarius]ACV57911.1 isochorismatase hydrolase [Alicyclobacillus acidocaldarius subsp. acidocaldarius DSM 446]
MGEALLVVDMSNDFVHDEGTLTVGKPGQAIVPYILSLADRMLASGGVVAICMDEHDPDDRHFRDWPPHNVRGTWGQQLYGDLAAWYERHKEHPDVWYVPKRSYNAFYNTGLGERLRERGVHRVHVCGVCTDICDFLTVAGAYDEGFHAAVHRQGCATFTDLGDIFLEHMRRLFHAEIA